MDTVATEATAMARGLPMLRPLLLPSQRLMPTTAMEGMAATDTERGPLMPTTVAMDMADMEATAMARGPLMLRPTMAMVAMAATDTARGQLMPTMAAMDTVATEATAMARGLPMLRPLLLPNQRLMPTTAMEGMAAMDTERGPLMPTMVAMDMEATAMARGLLMPMPTTVATDMAAMAVTATA